MNHLLRAITPVLLICCLTTGCQNLSAASGQVPMSAAAAPKLVAAPAVNLSRFEPAECWFQSPEGANITCGYVSVPEDYAQPMTPENTIRLAVAIFPSATAEPAPDPIVYHVGGPGGHMLNIVPYIYARVIAPYLETRDLTLFDPRGTGFSQPALECHKGEQPGDCLRRLFSEGHNLYAYNSINMAADMQELRAALGYDQWNLLGESYGTFVAQVALRSAPEGLRSVILDSVGPVIKPQLPGGRSTFEVSLQRLFQSCEIDPACNAAYPNLDERLDQAIQRLDAEPVTFQVNAGGVEQNILLTGERLSEMMFNALFETEMIPWLPSAISMAADGSDYSFWQNVVRWEAVIDDIVTDGVHWSVQCGDGRLGEECEHWPMVVEQTPVTSDIPLLILSGEFDPITPPEYGHRVAQGLSHSHVYDFPGLGHWVNGSGHPCQIAIIQDFLEDPTHALDATCIAKMSGLDFVIEP